MELIKILGICLIAVVPIVLLKPHRTELALMCSVAACCVVIMMLVSRADESIQRFLSLFDEMKTVSDYFKIALKALAIAHITGFVADTCRDFGQSALASKAELAGKLATFALAVPMLEALLEFAMRMAK